MHTALPQALQDTPVTNRMKNILLKFRLSKPQQLKFQTPTTLATSKPSIILSLGYSVSKF